MLQIAKPQPAIGLVNRQPVKAQLAHLRPQLFAREVILTVYFVAKRCNLLVSKARDAVTDHIGGLAKLEIEIGCRAHEISCQLLLRLLISAILASANQCDQPQLVLIEIKH